MRVLILVPAFGRSSPVMGAFLLAFHLGQTGDEAWLGALDDAPVGDPAVLASAARRGVATHVFGATGWAGLRHWRRVQRFVEDQRVDAVVSYCLRPNIVSARLRGCIRVASIRELVGKLYRQTLGKTRGSLVARAHVRMLRRHHALFAMTETMQRDLAGLGLPSERIRVIPNFIDANDVRARANPEGPPALLHAGGTAAPKRGLELGYFGSLLRMKRVDVLIRALHYLVSNSGHDHIRLHLVGHGPQRDALGDLAGSLGLGARVLFHGHLENPLPLMATVDIALLASESEGTPRSFLEAMAIGKTCVGPALEELADLLVPGETGYLYRPGNSVDLAARIAAIARDGLLPPTPIREHIDRHYDVAVGGDRSREELLALVRGLR